MSEERVVRRGRREAHSRGEDRQRPPYPRDSGGSAAERVLEERARRLAETDRPSAPEGALEVVVFRLARERYALEAAFVHEAFALAELAPLPGAEAPGLSVTLWRGGLLPLVDLRVPLGLEAPGLTDLGRVLVLGGERPLFGILADAVEGLASIPLSAIAPLPPGLAAMGEYMRGITAEAVVVLEADAVLRLHGG